MRMQKLLKFGVLAAVLLTLLLIIAVLQYKESKAVYQHKSEDEHTEQLLHIVTDYQIWSESPWKETRKTGNMSLLSGRQNETDEVLQRNLDHPLVKSVHLLVNQESVKSRLANLSFSNKQKIVIERLYDMPKYKNRIEYISKKLQNVLVVIAQSDIYLGEGFDKINKTFLTQENVCYALTRNGVKERNCDLSGQRGYCGHGYVGSHDTFVLALTKPISESVLEEMNYDPHVWGSENLLLWILKNMLQMKFLNPCKELKTYHNHCIRMAKPKPRVNLIKSVLVPESGMYFNIQP